MTARETHAPTCAKTLTGRRNVICTCSDAAPTDEHRYVITAPWGDEAEADTYDAALVARRQLGNDARDAGIEWDGWLDSITITDRGYAPEAA